MHHNHAFDPSQGDGTGPTVGTATIGASLHREPVMGLDGKVLGYVISIVLDRGAEPGTATEDEAALAGALHHKYLGLDLPNLVSDRLAFVPATPAMLEGFIPATAPGRLVLDLPTGFELTDDAARRATALRSLGAELALTDFRATPAQLALLPTVAFVVVDAHLFEPPLGEVVRAAHAAGTRVLATGVHDALTEDLCRLAAVDGLRGGSDHRAAAAAESSAPKVLRAGQLQCLAALHLLNKGDVDLGEVGQVIDTDPVLTLRVLHLVNSGAFALRREIDTVQHAVVLLGVREIANLVTALAIDARPDAMDSLWRILARALTCELLSGDPAGYTVGMLSALIGELGVPADVVLDKVGVSPAVADAVRALEGPMGQVLAAVLAHERNDAVGVVWAGYSHVDVSDAYVACLADALATVRTINPA